MTFVPVRKSFRLPRRFNRPVSSQMRAFVQRRHKRTKERRHEKFKRFLRRVTRLIADGRGALAKWAIVVSLTGIVLISCMFLFLPIAQVREIRVVRSDIRIDAEKIQRSLAPIFGRHLVFLLAQEVKQLVTAAVPDITDLEIDKQYPSRLVITLKLEPIIARLLIEDPDSMGTDSDPEGEAGFGAVTALPTSDFLTISGRYVSHPSMATSSDLPVFTIVDWGVRPGSGTPLIPPAFLEQLYNAEAAVREQFGLEITGRTVFLRAREFHLETKDFSLWFDRGGPLEEQLKRFTVFLETTQKEEVSEYIDLRLTDRIVYR